MKFVFLIFAMIPLFAQAQTREELIEQFMKERRQMMEQMMKIFQDDFENDSFLGDDFDPFGTFPKGNSFHGGGKNVKIDEKYEDDGSISIIITPQNKNINMDIQTNENLITIKTEMRIEEETKEGGNSIKSYSSSSSTRSIPIPQGYKAKSPVASGKTGIKISLVPQGEIKDHIKKKAKPKKSPNLRPIGKKPGEETI